MEKFAVVLNPDDGRRIINRHPVLKRLPERIAQKCLPRLSAQKAGLILEAVNHENLGSLIDVPGFFSNWADLEDEKRYKILTGIIRTLNKMDISVLSFPWLYYYLTDDEIDFLYNEGIILLDGFYHRLAGMLLVLKQVFSITSKEVPGFEVGIWGADTDIGQVWVEAMASEVNHMCIGGRDYNALERLADYILTTTGLACQITLKPEVCLSNKNITVLASPVKVSFSRKQPSFHFESAQRGGQFYFGQSNKAGHRFTGNQYADSQYAANKFEGNQYAGNQHTDSQYAGNKYQGSKHKSRKHLGYDIELGWMAPPQDVEILEKLNPWEELGVLDGLFYAVSRVYREEILFKKITLEQIKRLHALYELYPIKLQGFIHQGNRIHFDRFRRDYFG